MFVSGEDSTEVDSVEVFNSGEVNILQEYSILETTEEILYEGNVISQNVFLGFGIGGVAILFSAMVMSFLRIIRKGVES